MKNILICGDSSGIGAALNEQLAGEAQLYSASRTEPDGPHVRHIHWDSASETFPAEALPDVLDGLVYCPGSIRLQPFSKISEEAFLEDFNLNAMGAVRVLQASLPALMKPTSASVVLFSTVAVSIGMPMHASVAAAKGAVEGLTRSLAAEWAPKVRVNAIAPSLIDTPLASGLLRTDKEQTAAAMRHPSERIGNASEVAALAQYLLSDNAVLLSGQIFPVDGGITKTRRFNT